MRKVQFSIFIIFFSIFLLFYGPSFFIYHFDEGIGKYSIRTANILCCFIVALALGYIAQNNLLAAIGKSNTYSVWQKRPWASSYINPYLVLPFAAASFLVMVLGLFVYGGIAAFWQVISNPAMTALDIKELRADNGVTGWIRPFFVYNNIFFSRVISFLFLSYALISGKAKYKIAAYVYVSLVLLCAFASLQKITGLYFIVQLIVFQLLYYNVRMNFMKIIGVTVVLVFILVNIYMVVTTASNAQEALSIIGFRIFSEPNRLLTLYFTTWPDLLPHTHGLNIRFVYAIFGDHTVPFIPSNIRLPDVPDNSWDSFFVADAWVDFGYWGVIVQSFLVGIYLSALDNWLFSKKNRYQVALITALVFSGISLANLALVTTCLGFGLLTYPLFYYFFKIRIDKRTYVPAAA